MTKFERLMLGCTCTAAKHAVHANDCSYYLSQPAIERWMRENFNEAVKSLSDDLNRELFYSKLKIVIHSKWILASLAFLISLTCVAQEPIKVAIVDTGLNLKDKRFSKVLCKEGHTDFTGTGLDDTDGHGTHIAGIIKSNANKSNYCLVIYKYYSESARGDLNISRGVAAFQKAVYDGVKIINFSAGGSERSRDEYEVIKYNPGTTFVVAAGNEGQDLDGRGGAFYPASYRLPNIIAVGNLDIDGRAYHNSNYATWLKWEVGTNVMSTVPCKVKGMDQDCVSYMTGTSMAAAVRTGKLIKEMLAKP